jgi:hypothetical protein
VILIFSLFAISWKANFDMDTDSEFVKAACTDMLQKRSKNKRHYIKKKYFDSVPANQVSIKSPVDDLTDEEWQGLVAVWSTAKHKVCLYMCPWVFFICACFGVFAAVTC